MQYKQQSTGSPIQSCSTLEDKYLKQKFKNNPSRTRLNAQLHVLTILAAYSGKLIACSFFAFVLHGLCIIEKYFSFAHCLKLSMETTY